MNYKSTLAEINTDMPNSYIYTYKIHKSNRKTNTLKKNMIKQKACGLILAVAGMLPILIEKDVTAFIFFSFFFLPMIFGKQYIMTFKD